jgi:hypothetical protein
MMRKILLTAIMASFATLSHAEVDDFVKRFDGAIRLTVTGTNACKALLPPNNDRASFYVYFDDYYESSGLYGILTRFRDDDQAESIIFDGYQNNEGYSIARTPRGGGYPMFVGFLLFHGLPVPLIGQFDITQTPATIEDSTKFLSLSGTLFDYPLPDCQAELKATFARNEDFVEPTGALATRLMRQLRSFRAKARQP